MTSPSSSKPIPATSKPNNPFSPSEPLSSSLTSARKLSTSVAQASDHNPPSIPNIPLRGQAGSPSGPSSFKDGGFSYGKPGVGSQRDRVGSMRSEAAAFEKKESGGEVKGSEETFFEPSSIASTKQPEVSALSASLLDHKVAPAPAEGLQGSASIEGDTHEAKGSFVNPTTTSSSPAGPNKPTQIDIPSSSPIVQAEAVTPRHQTPPADLSIPPLNRTGSGTASPQPRSNNNSGFSFAQGVNNGNGNSPKPTKIVGGPSTSTPGTPADGTGVRTDPTGSNGTPPTFTPSSVSEIPDEEKIRILRKHLVSAQERHAGEAERNNGSNGETPSPNTNNNNNAGGVGGQSGIFLDVDGPSSATGPHGQRRESRKSSSSHQKVAGESLVDLGGAREGGQSGVVTVDSDPFGDDAGGGGVGTSGFSNGYGGTDGGHERVDTEQFPIPYDALGGDITHSIYKWQNTARMAAQRRSRSFSAVQRNPRDLVDPSLKHLHEPGGFRRQFVINQAVTRGEEEPRVLRSFVDFLYLYGHFAGEDLHEDDDEDEDDGLPTLAQDVVGAASEQGLTRRVLSRGMSERAPLLGPSRSVSTNRVRRARGVGEHGDATVMQAVLMLLKGFVGTGVLFLGKAFFNGGILFSTLVLLFIASISLWSFLLLVKTRLVIPGSFGDIGGILYGKYMRAVILASIALSQIGFVAAYTIFVAENLQAFVLGVTNCKTFIQTKYLIAAQLVVFLPLAMIRNLAALSSTALIADLFILVGLIYIAGNEIGTIATKGVADVALFNPKDFSLLIGTAVFAFEGIGLIIPITEAMAQPEKFPRVLSIVMIFVALLFASFGVMGYAAYGSDIQTVVIVNLPQEDKFVQVVQFLYTIAIVLSLPLQLFPAVRIMETSIFSKQSGKHNPRVKLSKNLFRAGTVVACSLVSWAGAKNLDGFVSLIGSFACLPLALIFPAALHLKACAKTRAQRALDYGLIVFGIMTTCYMTVQTVMVLIRSAAEEGGTTKFGKCEVPGLW